MVQKQQLKQNFNGTDNFYTKSVSYTFRQNEIVTDKPNYLGFAVKELSKLSLYETYYDTLQTYFGKKVIQLQKIYTDSLVLGIKTKNVIEDLKNLKDLFD